MKTKSLRPLFFLWLFIIGFSLPTELLAQTQGLIFKPATGDGNAVLNPGSTGNVFEDPTEPTVDLDFVIPFINVPSLADEVFGDISRGPSGGFTDVVSNSAGDGSSYMYYDNDNDLLLFRMRLGKASSAAKGYSFLFANENLGPSNPNFTASNPGFNFEVVYISGSGVKVIDNTGTTVGTLLSEAQYHQRAVSEPTFTGTIGDDGPLGVFYDFYIDLSLPAYSDLKTFLNDGFRVLSSTSINPKGVLEGGNASDIGGVDNNDYNSDNAAFTELINTQENADLGDISEGGGGFPAPVAVTNTPVISSPINVGETSISGFIAEAEDTDITVSVFDGTSTTEYTTTSTGSFTWEVTVPALSEDDEITARATATGKDESALAGPVIVGASLQACLAPNLAVTVTGNQAGQDRIQEITITSTGLNAFLTDNSDNDYFFRIYRAGTTDIATTSETGNPIFPDQQLPAVGADLTNPSTDSFEITTGNGSDGLQDGFSYEVVVYQAATSPLCETARSNPITSTTQTTPAPPVAPAIAPDEYLSSLTTVTGTGVNGNEIILYQNGVEVGIRPTVSDGEWSVGSLSLTAGDTFRAVQKNGNLVSGFSNTATVTSAPGDGPVQSVPPTITGSSYLSTESLITGTSPEGAGTTIRVFDQDDNLIGTATVQLDGTWSIDLDPATLGSLSVTSFTATAEGPGKSESDPTDPVSVFATQLGAPTVTSPILVGDPDITVTGVASGETVRLFVDGSLAGTATASGGSVTFTAIASPLADVDDPTSEIYEGDIYRDGIVTATRSSASTAESDPSAGVTILGVESFRIEYADGAGVVIGDGTITTQSALDLFNIRITARDGTDGVFSNFNGNVVFNPNFQNTATRDGDVVIGTFTSGVLFSPYGVTALESLADAEIFVFNQDDIFVNGTSNEFIINSPEPGTDPGDLQVDSVTPNRAPRDTPGRNITIIGDGFIPTSIVQFEDKQLPDGPSIFEDLTTTYISETELQAIIPLSLLEQQSGEFQVQVTNPAPAGGTSNQVPFNITSCCAGLSDVETAPQFVVADNNDFGLIIAKIRDGDGDPVIDLTAVDFDFNTVWSEATNEPVISNFTNAGNGIYTWEVRSANEEVGELEVELEVTIGGQAPVPLLDKPTITFVAPSVNAADALSFVTPIRSFYPEGTSNYITVQLVDEDGNPVLTGATVTLASTETTDFAFRNLADDANITDVTIPVGVSSASFRYTSDNIGEHTMTVSSGSLVSDDQIVIVQAAGIPVAARTTVRFPATATAGVESGEFRVVIRDAEGRLLDPALIGDLEDPVLSILPGSPNEALSPIVFDDISGGAYRGTYTPTVTGTDAFEVTFEYQTTTITVPGTFETVVTAGAFSAANSFIEVSPTAVANDGDDAATLLVSLFDVNGNPLTDAADADFSFNNLGGSIVTFVTEVQPGVYQFGITNNTTATVEIDVLYDGGSGPTLIDTTPEISFVDSFPSLGLEFAFVSPEYAIMPNAISGLITVQLVGPLGGVVVADESSGVTIFLSSNDGTGIFRDLVGNDVTAVTVLEGQSSISFRYVSPTPGYYVLTAEEDTDLGIPFSATQNITIIGEDLPVASNSTADVPAGEAGQETTITITLRDVNGDPLAGVDPNDITVEFAAGSANFDNNLFSAITDNSDGTYTLTYTPVRAGDDLISISVDMFGDPVEISGSPYTSTVSAGPVSVANSTLEVYPTNIVSDGDDEATIIVKLVDTFGNPIEAATLVDFGTTVSTGTAIVGGFTDVGGGYYVAKVTSGTAGEIEIDVEFDSQTIGTAELESVAAGGAATELVFSSPERAGYVDQISNLMVVQLLDASGVPSLAGAGGVTVTLSTDETGTFYDEAGDVLPPFEVTILEGQSSVAFRYSGDSPLGTHVLTADPDGLASTTQNYTLAEPGVPTPSQFIVDVPNGLIDQSTEITVTVRDAAGYIITDFNVGDFVADVTGANTATPSITDNGDGTVTITYTPTNQGTDEIELTFGGAPIGLSPYTSTVFGIIFVDAKDGNDTNDGSEWGEAYQTIQAAIDDAVSGQVIWVRGFDDGTVYDLSSDTDFITFDGKKLELYGGFDGTETSLADRDLGAGFVTTIQRTSGQSSDPIINVESIADGTSLIDGFTIKGGNNSGSGGAIVVRQADLIIRNVTFVDNKSEVNGGAVYISDTTNVTVINSLFYGNEADNGSALGTWAGNVIIVNSTFSNNTTTGEDAGTLYADYGATVNLRNSILWGNVHNDGGRDIVLGSEDSPTFVTENSLVQGSGGGSWNTTDFGDNGGGNLDVDPQFVDSDGNDYRIVGTSPAVDAGNDTFTTGLATTDIRGGDRFLDGTNGTTTGTVDMGAYEFDFTSDPLGTSLLTVHNLTTGDRTPIITGTVNFVTGSSFTVEILDGTTVISTYVFGTNDELTIDESGNWTLRIPAGSPLADGTYTVRATYDDVVDAPISAEGTLVINSTFPAAPYINPVTTSTDTDPLIITGTVDPSLASTLEVEVDGIIYVNDGSGDPLDIITVDADGNWSLEISGGLAQGEYEVVATVEDGGESASSERTIDITGAGLPVAPTIDPLITTNNKPATGIGGNADVPAGGTLKVIVGGITYTDADTELEYDDTAKTWTLDLSAVVDANALVQGLNTVQAIIENSTGDIASTSRDIVLVNAPTVNAQATGDTTPKITGTADLGPDGTYSLTVDFDGTEYVLGVDDELTIDAAGNWSLQLPLGLPLVGLPLASGEYDVTVTVNAGGTTFTDDAKINIDSNVVVAPYINPLSTSDTTPTITGTVDPSLAPMLQVTVDGETYSVLEGEITVDGDGNWSFTADKTTLSAADSPYTVVATAFFYSSERDIIITSDGPEAPAVNPLITSNPQATLGGTLPTLDTGEVFRVEVNGVVYVFGVDAALTVDDSTTPDTWSLNLVTAGQSLNNGNNSVTAWITDASGDVGLSAADIVLVNEPTVNAQTTGDNTPIITGTADLGPNGTYAFNVEIDGETYTLGTNPELTIDAAGNWTLQIPSANALVDGDYTVTATVSAGGTEFETVAIDAITIDTATPLPNAPTIDALSTSDTTPTITGTVPLVPTGNENDLEVVVLDKDGNTIGTFQPTDAALTVNPDGTWELDITTALDPNDGPFKITASAGGASSERDIFITPAAVPEAPTITGPLAVETILPTITGTVQDPRGGIFRVEVAGVVYTEGDGNLSVDGSGNWTLVVPPVSGSGLSIGVNTVTAWVTAPDGSIGLTSRDITVTSPKLFVTETPGGSEDGSDWADGISLQDALNIATPGTEIWVQTGSYLGPFTLTPGIGVYGGFDGTEDERDERDLTQPAILNGGGACHTVEVPSGAGNDTILDGFNIINGNAVAACANGGNGGGIYNEGSPRIINVTFGANNAENLGGGFFSTGVGANPVLINVLFIGNAANDGSAIAVADGSNAIIINGTFTSNTSTAYTLFRTGGATIVLNNSILWANVAPSGETNAAPMQVSASIIEGGLPDAMEIIEEDPQFVNPAGGNFSLRLTSPGLNAGVYDFYATGEEAEGVIIDILGNLRFFGQIDLGSFESGTKGTVAGPAADGNKKFNEWHMLGSPAVANYRQLLTPFWTQGIPGADFPGGDKNIYYWDSASEGYRSPSNLNQTIPAGRGHFFFVYDDVNYNGLPDGFPKTIAIRNPENAAEVTVNLFADQPTGEITDDERFPRWNMISNPWGIPIRIDWLLNQIDDQIGTGVGDGALNRNVYMWSPNDGTIVEDDYPVNTDQLNNPLSLIGKYDVFDGTTPDQYIPPFQAFWIHFEEQFSGGGGSRPFVMRKADLTEPLEDVDFDIDLLDYNIDRVKLPMAVFNNDGTAGVYNVVFDSRIQEGEPHTFDALALTPPRDAYTILHSVDDRNFYVGNSLPRNPESYREFNLDVTSVKDGEMTLAWMNMPAELSGIGVTILDTWTGEVLRLDKAGTYKFTHSSSGLLDIDPMGEPEGRPATGDQSGKRSANVQVDAARKALATQAHSTSTTRAVETRSVVLGDARGDMPQLGMPGLHRELPSAEQLMDGTSSRFILRIDPEGFAPLPELPEQVSLSQNYPNPFNPTTNITFGLPEAGEVTLEVYNVLGQRVATLVNGPQQAGMHTINFDARRLASGVYLYRLQAGNRVITKKMTLIK